MKHGIEFTTPVPANLTELRRRLDSGRQAFASGDMIAPVIALIVCYKAAVAWGKNPPLQPSWLNENVPGDVVFRQMSGDFAPEFSRDVQCALAEMVAWCDGAEAETTVTTPAPKPHEPLVILSGWREILDAVGLKSVDRSKLQSLNERFNGPIPRPGKGGQPVVGKVALIDWYNRLALIQQEMANQREGVALTSKNQYQHGKSEVVPEIGGVKRRKGKR